MPGQVIQGYFPNGSPRQLVQPIQPATIQPRVAHPLVVQARPNPYATPPLAHQQHMAKPNVAQPRTSHSPRPPITPASAMPHPPHARPAAPIVQRTANGQAFQLPPSLLNFATTPGQPLPHPVRQKMESFFKTSFADVRIHVGPQATSIGALAFTHGSNLYFAPGQYNPNTTQGQQLLGHELTHVMQQRGGRVCNPFGSGIAMVQDHNMEAEADRMGMRAAWHLVTVQAKSTTPLPIALHGDGQLSPSVIAIPASVQLAKSGFSKCDASVISDSKRGEGSYKNGIHGEINALEAYLEAGGKINEITEIVISSPPCKYCHIILSDLGLRDKVVCEGEGFGSCQGGSYGWFWSEGRVSKAVQAASKLSERNYVTTVITRVKKL